MIRLVSLMFCLILAGCAQRGAFIEPDQAKELSSKITTATELADTLGTPTVTIPVGNGKTRWIYEGVLTRPNAATYIPIFGIFAAGVDKKCTKLTVLVDNESGSVSDFNYETLKSTDYIYGKQQLDSCKSKPSVSKKNDEKKSAKSGGEIDD